MLSECAPWILFETCDLFAQSILLGNPNNLIDTPFLLCMLVDPDVFSRNIGLFCFLFCRLYVCMFSSLSNFVMVFISRHEYANLPTFRFLFGDSCF
jgi:hypothetical protein